MTAAGSGFLLLWWILSTVPEEWKSLTILAWMMVFLVASFAIFRRTGKREPFYVYAGVGLAMLAAATSVEFKGDVLVTALTIEAAMVPVVSYYVLRDVKVASYLAILFIGPILLSFDSMTGYAWQYNFVTSFTLLTTLGISLSGVGLFFRNGVSMEERHIARTTYLALLIAGSLYGLLIIWRYLTWDTNSDQAIMFALVIYTVIGLFTHYYGKFKEHKVLRIYGTSLLGFVVARLLFVEIWSMNIAGRTITFFAIGALLMSTAFVGRRQKIPNPNVK